MKISDGQIHSPYFIFLEGRLSDHEILRLLGLENFLPVELTAHRREREVCITEDNIWMHVADDWWYTLWYKGLPILERLHCQRPQASLFACSVGDSDDSFGFTLYAGGQLQRRLEVHDPNFNRKARTVKVNVGNRLSIEDEEREKGEPWAYVSHLARQLGVVFNHKPENTRCYAAPSKRLAPTQLLAP